MEKEVVEKKKTPPAVISKAAAKHAEKRLDQAHAYYGQMQRHWFMFAKEIRAIRDEHDCDILGVESFQKLCEREFPLLSYSTISKFIQIVEKLGDQIDTRIGKKSDYILPAYETCYQLTAAESKVKAEEYTKLKKQILDDNKLTVRAFRERLKDLLSTASKSLRVKVEADADEFIEKTQKEFSKELEEEDWDDESKLMADEDENYEPDDEDMEEIETDVKDVGPSEDTAISLSARVDYLVENLPDFVDQLDKIDGQTKTLVKKLKKLIAVATDTIQTIEEK